MKSFSTFIRRAVMMSAAAGTLSVSAQTVIFTNSFSTQSDFDKFTVVDYNGDISTGINEVRADGTEVDDQSFYNLSGERVYRNFRGIVIHNGKKYVRKTK